MPAQAPVHTSTPRGFDLQHARRECGEVVIQLGVGQMVDEQADIRKATAISFTVPWNGEASELLDYVRTRLPMFAGVEETATFGRDEKYGKIVATFASSQSTFTNGTLQQFPLFFDILREAVAQNRHIPKGEKLEGFSKRIDDYSAKSANLIEDARFILTNPTHGGARAYRNAQMLGDGLYRMELIDDGTKIVTLAPPHKGYEPTVYNEKLCADLEDIQSMLALLAHIEFSYQNGAKSVFFMNVNATKKVPTCGGSDQIAEASREGTSYTDSLTAQMLLAQTQIQTQPSLLDASIVVSSGSGDESGSSGTTQSANSSSTTTNNSSKSQKIDNLSKMKVRCSNCQRMHDQGVLCKCMLIGIKRIDFGAILQIHSH